MQNNHMWSYVKELLDRRGIVALDSGDEMEWVHYGRIYSLAYDSEADEYHLGIYYQGQVLTDETSSLELLLVKILESITESSRKIEGESLQQSLQRLGRDFEKYSSQFESIESALAAWVLGFTVEEARNVGYR